MHVYCNMIGKSYSSSLIFVLIIQLASCDFQLKTNQDGSYQILVNGELWINSNDTVFQVQNTSYSLMKKTLQQVKANTEMGRDLLGPYTKYVYSYKANSVLIDTAIKNYETSNLLRFSQTYISSAEGTSVYNKDSVISQFPQINVGAGNVKLGVLCYNNVFSGFLGLKIYKFVKGMKTLPGGIGTGPLIIFDEQDNVLIISPFNKFMAQSFEHNAGANVIGWGIMGNVNTVPPGYEMETMVFYSDKGINQAMQEWGLVMRKWYKRGMGARESDVIINYLGYYTDNGAYYYHLTEPGLNYEQTLLKEFEYYKKLGIPYRYLQLDDWWYFYETSKSSYGAVTRWIANPAMLPHGLQYLYNKSNLPVMAHNRFWSYKTPYAKQNGGTYDFIVDDKSGMALPLEERFWDFLFQPGPEWGLVTYEQDFMITQLDEIKELNTDISLGQKWLRQMGNSAEKYNLKLQYCMAAPRQILQALEVPPVSHARASDDYINANNWKMGYTSMFVDSVGLAPSKDVTWTTPTQPGNPYKRIEVNVERETVVALLSTGPVGVGDKIGYTNVAFVKRVCRTDGLLLKPSKPATAINQQIIQRAFGGVLQTHGEIYTTYSDISNNRFGIIFASETAGDFKMTPMIAGFDEKFGLKMVTYPMLNETFDVKKIQPFSEDMPLVLENLHGSVAIHLFFTSPVFYINGVDTVLILGEMDKYVPVSPNRVQNIVVEFSDIAILLNGQTGEMVEFAIVYNNRLVVYKCTMRDDGKALISVANNKCN